MARNPFSAIASAFSGAVSAVRDFVGGAASTVRDFVTPGRQEAPTLPQFPGGGVIKDDRLLGADSEPNRTMDQAAANFVADRGGLAGLDADARGWLEAPTISDLFGDYWVSGGFTADQILKGMTSISNVQIRENADGSISVSFDYESEVDEYEVAGHVG